MIVNRKIIADLRESLVPDGHRLWEGEDSFVYLPKRIRLPIVHRRKNGKRR